MASRYWLWNEKSSEFKERRKHKGWTQKQLAEQVSCGLTSFKRAKKIGEGVSEEMFIAIMRTLDVKDWTTYVDPACKALGSIQSLSLSLTSEATLTTSHECRYFSFSIEGEIQSDQSRRISRWCRHLEKQQGLSEVVWSPEDNYLIFTAKVTPDYVDFLSAVGTKLFELLDENERDFRINPYEQHTGFKAKPFINQDSKTSD